MDPKRAKELVEEIFTTKLREKEEEIEAISQRIKEVQHNLQLVRYGAVSAMSNQTQIYVRILSKYQVSLSYLISMILLGTSK